VKANPSCLLIFHAACRFPTYRCRYATGYGNVICYTHTRGPYSRH